VDSLLVMLDVKGLDFSYIRRIRQQNFIPKAGGNLGLADSASRHVQIGHSVIAKLTPFLSTDSSHVVRTCSDKLMINFSNP
jgi:hypothetical protein